MRPIIYLCIMPYKDKEKQKERNRVYQAKYYSKNKDYYKNKAKDRRKDIKEDFRDFKINLKCTQCGEDHPACLDFHHIDEKSKDTTISFAIASGWGKERVQKEIDKCVVLCSNCHRKLHYKIRVGEGVSRYPHKLEITGSIPVPETTSIASSVGAAPSFQVGQ